MLYSVILAHLNLKCFQGNSMVSLIGIYLKKILLIFASPFVQGHCHSLLPFTHFLSLLHTTTHMLNSCTFFIKYTLY